MIETQFSTTIQILQTDGGTEYAEPLKSYLFEHGIISQSSCPSTPQQNGIVERKIRHITETGRALMIQSGFPETFWAEFYATAVYLINRLPTAVLSNQSPYSVMHNRLSDYDFLKTFGCRCFPLLTHFRKNKLQPKTLPCVFIGYSDRHKGYKGLEVKSNRIYISRHVIFDESIFTYATDAGVISPVLSSNPSTATILSWPNTIYATHLTPPSTSPPTVSITPLPSQHPYSNLSSPSPDSTATPTSHTSSSFPASSINPRRLSFSTDDDSSSPSLSPVPAPSSPRISSPSSTSLSSSKDPSSTQSTSSADLPIVQEDPQSIPNAHPMVTRLKDHTIQRKSFKGCFSSRYPLLPCFAAHYDSLQPEPSCFTAASKFPEWWAAML